MSIKTLIVDDDRSLLEQAEGFLERIDNEIKLQTLFSAEKALDVINEEDFDVIVSDYQMPEMDGLELLEEIREKRDSDIPFIMFTGKGREEVAIEALNLGADQYVQKKGGPKSQYRVLVNAIEQEVEHHRTKLNLKNSEKKYRKLVETTGDIIIKHDRDGKIEFVNQAGLDFAGYSEEEFKGKNVTAFLPEDEIPDLLERKRKRIEEGNKNRFKYETAFVNKDGEQIDVDVESTPLLEEGEYRGNLVVARDVTDRKEIEEELQESEQRLELAVEGAELGVWDWNLKTDEVKFNERWAEMLGHSLDEIEPTVDSWEERVHPDDLEEAKSAIEAYLNGKAERYDVEFRFKHKDGSWIWINGRGKIVERDENGEPLHFVGTHIDITERKKAKEELIAQQNLLEGVLDNIEDILAIQKPDHTIERYNRAGYDILGITPEEAKGKKCYELIGRDQECEECATRKALQRGEMEQVEKYVPELDVYLDCRSNPIFDEDGNVVRVVEQLRDITERKEKEEKLREREERLDSLISQTPAVIYSYEVPEGSDETPETTYVSENVKDVLGFESDYFVDSPENFEECLHPEDAQELFEKEGKLMTDEDTERITVEYRFKDKQGDYRWLHDEQKMNTEGGRKEVIGAWWDITERKQAEAALEENKNKIERLNEIGAEIQSCDSEEEVYSLAVEAAEDILDFEICSFDAVEEGMFVTKEVSSDTPEEMYTERQIEESGLGSKTYLNQESYLVNELHSDEEAKPIKSDYKSAISIPVGDHGVFQSVSKETDHFDEDDLNTAKLLISHVSEALDRIQVKEREEFLHSLLRHDVDNKNNLIKGYLELMKDYDLPDEVKEFAKKSESAVEESSEMIAKTRKMRKIGQEEEIGEVNLNSVADKVLSGHSNQLEEKGIELKIEDCDYWVKGGPLLEALFSNLVDNALKHSDCDEISISSQVEDDEFVAVVEDDGVGIPEEIKDKIFGKGFKRGETAGTGLGLYMVKEIAESYGGSVEVKDSELGGARFEIHLQRIQ